MSDKLCSNGFLLTFYAAIGSWCQSPAWAALLAPTDIRPEQKEDIQTAGWNETLMALFEAYIIIEGLFITHRAITERPQAFAWQTDLIASAVIVSDHSDVTGLLIWTPPRLRYNCIFSDQNFRASHEILSECGPASPSFCYVRVQSAYRVIWALRGLWETHGTWKAPCIFCKSLSKWEMTSFKQL